MAIKRNSLGRFVKVEKIKRKCFYCQKACLFYPSEIKRGRRFCSDYCASKWFSEYHRGKIHHRYKQKIRIKCQICKKYFYVIPGRLNKKYKVKYCSNKCKGLAMRDPTKNERDQFYLTNEWIKLRKKVYKRDNYRCQICGNGKESGKRVAHHLDEISKSEKQDWINVDRIITLCIRCHNKIHDKFGANNPRRKKVI